MAAFSGERSWLGCCLQGSVLIECYLSVIRRIIQTQGRRDGPCGEASSLFSASPPPGRMPAPQLFLRFHCFAGNQEKLD
jgi:hypothetical protein